MTRQLTWRRGLFVLVLSVQLGCLSPAKPCNTDSECGADGRCDVAAGVCFGPAGRVDSGSDCQPACPDPEECSERVCKPRYTGVLLSQLSPTTLRPSSTFNARASLVRNGERQDAPPAKLSLVVRGPGGAVDIFDLPRVGEFFEAAVQAPANGGQYAVSARYEQAGLESTPVDLVVDGSPPLLSLTLVPAQLRPAPTSTTTFADPAVTDGGAYRRDEQLEVIVTAPEPLQAATVSLAPAIGGGASLTVQLQENLLSSCGLTQGYCGKASVDLWRLPMNAFRERFTVAANGTDLAGNSAQGLPAEIRITRFKWRYEAGTTVTSPALDSAGNVYFLAGAPNLPSTLGSLDSSGRVRFSLDAGVAGTNAAIGRADGGEELVFWGSGGATAGLFAARTGDGGLVAACGPYGGSFEGGIALMTTDVAAETVVALSTANGGTLVALKSGAGTASCVSRQGTGTMPTDLSSIVSHQGSIFFGNDTGQVASFNFNAANGIWDLRSGWPAGATLFTRALAVVGTEIVGGGGGGPSQGGVFTLLASSGGMPTWEHRTPVPAWSPAVADGGMVFVGINGPSVLSVMLRADAGVTAQTAGVVRGTPVIGEGGLLYLVSLDGTLSVRGTVPGAAPLWEHGGLGQVRSSATLDCARDSSGGILPGRPGTLYAPTEGGSLHAIIVDSRGLDATAPWPKYQRDVQNSGNPHRAISACP